VKGVVYQGARLMPGSDALRMHSEGNWLSLRSHMARLDREGHKRGDVPLRPCRSPYCECSQGQCSHPGCFDAR
jgi:hypothetical protein